MKDILSYLLKKAESTSRENNMGDKSETSKQTQNRPETIRNRARGRNATYSFPSEAFPHGIQFIFKDYDYNKFISVLDKGKTVASDTSGDLGRIEKFGLNAVSAGAAPKSFTSIELPFPRTLLDQNNIRNEGYERSFLFERLTSSLAAAGDVSGIIGGLEDISTKILSGVRKIGSGEFSSSNIQSMLPDFGDAAAAAQYISRTILPGDLSKQLGQAGGFIANPQQSLAFTGVDLKNFTFQWDLFPSNRADSEQLKRIIQVLKHKALPGVSNIGTVAGGSRAFLTYPDVVVINLLGIDESHFVRFKPAMLTNVSVDYGTGGQVSILRGGKPAAVTLSLSFTELNIHTREDYPMPVDFVGDINVSDQTERTA